MAAFAVRVVGLGGWSLWYDETVSVYLARLPLGDMLAHTAGDIHPPGYYALLHLWQMLAQPLPGHGLEYLYGWVSVACGMAMVALLYAIGVRTVGARASMVGLWLAAINPFQLWYAQEVRMYTLGGALALLALYATLRWFDDARLRGGWRWLAVYALAVAAGLWSLYYFVFVLVGLGAASLALARSWRRWIGWAGANVAGLLLFAPWLGVFWRQASDPPVPPWRVAWDDLGAVAGALGEALTALVAGQSAWGSQWVWALLAGVILLIFVLTVRAPRRPGWALVAFLLAPLAALFAVTLFVTPLYHVRYTFLFAGVFALIAGAVVVWTWKRDRVAGGVMVALLVAASVLSIWNLRSDPVFARDDHRAAVDRLMREWRPGDVVLVNAGWAYTPLEVYWRTSVQGTETMPPMLAAPVRLGDALEAGGDELSVPVVRTGSGDGAASLGWGSPDSDFFALSSDATIAGLETLREEFDRIWHYRIYDTVSDPGGVIRAWLDANTRVVRDEAIAGRDFGRLELREFLPNLDSAEETAAEKLPDTSENALLFGNLVTLLDSNMRGDLVGDGAYGAGTMLYATLMLSPTAELLSSPQAIATSLRLLDAQGSQVAQQDLTLPPVEEWGGALRSPLALAIPADLPDGDYSLGLILYTANDGAAQPTAQGDVVTLASFPVEGR